MYTFSQLLIRNCILGLIFIAITAGLIIFSASNFTAEQAKSFRQTVHAVAQSDSFDAKTFADKLAYQQSMQRLSITSQSGESLLTHEQPTPLLANLLNTKEFKVTVKASGETISFVKNTADVASLIGFILIIITIATIAFVIFAAVASNKRYQKVFNRFSDQIKYEVEAVLSKGVTEQAEDTEQILEIPALKQGLKEIHDLLEAQKATSSNLESEAYIDTVTDLPNRNKFIQYFENEISAEKKITCGVLIITRCSELQTINQIHGYNEGDQYIKSVADIVKNRVAAFGAAKVFRLNSSDFATVMPNVRLKEAEKYAAELSERFNAYQQSAEIDSVAYSGLVFFDKEKPLGELLALADTGISVAQTQQINSFFAQKDNDIINGSSASYGNQNWRQEIDSVLEHQRVSLLVQHIQPTARNSKAYGEILARFLNSNDEMLPTASFIAMAEKLDKIVAVDRMIIETAIQEITSKNIVDQIFGINICARTIHDEHFLVWLERRLLREPNVAPRLVFEITEYGLQQNIRTSKRFIDMLHRVGSRVTVERFGVGLTSFKFFRDLKPDFIKMDSTYTRDIDDDQNNQYFLRLMVDLAHRLSINVLAESVESQEEKHTLEKLFIDGCQGFYIGKPTTM